MRPRERGPGRKAAALQAADDAGVQLTCPDRRAEGWRLGGEVGMAVAAAGKENNMSGISI